MHCYCFEGNALSDPDPDDSKNRHHSKTRTRPATAASTCLSLLHNSAVSSAVTAASDSHTILILVIYFASHPGCGTAAGEVFSSRLGTPDACASHKLCPSLLLMLLRCFEIRVFVEPITELVALQAQALTLPDAFAPTPSLQT